MRKSLSFNRNSQNVIQADGLVKRFGRIRALDGLDLEVRQGEVHGFLGPNGAGKSTTIRAILGQLHLGGGRLTVFGRHPVRDAVAIHRRIAYVPGDTALWPNLSGGECIDLLAGFFGGVDARRRADLVERFELDPRRRTRTYSKGNRQKVVLIAALASRAELLLLDEPTSGLDPLMEMVFQHAVDELRSQGRTVLLSSHILDEVEALCDRVTIIRGGKTVRTGTMASLRADARVHIDVATANRVADLPEAHDVTREAGAGQQRLTCTVPAHRLAEILPVISAANPAALTVRPPTLDEIFLAEYEERAR